MSRTRTFAARAAGLAATALVVAACASRQDPERAAVEYKGTNPSAAGTATAPATAPATPTSPTGPLGAGGIVSYEGYQAAVAREGDTVASVANRIGLSPSELGAYNGLPPDHQLRAGDELVLPPSPNGYGAGTGQTSTGTGMGTGTQIAQAQTGMTPGATQSATIEAAPLETAPIGQTGTGTPARWSPEVAAAAIDRAEGFDDEGNPGVPPSANEPLPPDPERPAELASPRLGQYQTRGPEPRPETAQTAASTAAQPPAPRPTETISTPAEQPVEQPAEQPAEQTAEQTQVAAAAPAAPAELRLIRPARGPIVVGFQEGPGRSRNDGVDFASPVGSPVVAAADGEVALVSQSLGGLGTIVLLRHQGDYLTVYGRIDRVAVRKGDIVSQGQQIGVVASNAEPRMHFEVRRGAESLDPERFLTGRS